MRPTETLMKEITCIRKALDILSCICGKIEKGDKVNHLDLHRVINFFNTFVDQCHNKKEEEILFPEIDELGQKDHEQTIHDLKSDNELGRFYTELLSKACDRMKSGNKMAGQQLVDVSKKYIQLESEHLDKEIRYIFPICQEKFSEDMKTRLTEEFNQMEDKKFGAGQHESFHDAMEQMIDRMAGTYLNAS